MPLPEQISSPVDETGEPPLALDKRTRFAFTRVRDEARFGGSGERSNLRSTKMRIEDLESRTDPPEILVRRFAFTGGLEMTAAAAESMSGGEAATRPGSGGSGDDTGSATNDTMRSEGKSAGGGAPIWWTSTTTAASVGVPGSVDVEFGRAQARDMLQHLWAGPISNASVNVVRGDHSVEVHAVGVTKGTAMDRILGEIVKNNSMTTPIDYVLCIGSFLVKDEDVYTFFEPGLTKKIKPSLASDRLT